MHLLALCPAHLKDKLHCLFVADEQSVSQLTLGWAEQDGVISVFKVRQLVVAKRYTRNPLADVGHQVV